MNRHGRFREAEAFRFVFEQVLKRRIEEGLIGGEGFAVDASVVKADVRLLLQLKDRLPTRFYLKDCGKYCVA